MKVSDLLSDIENKGLLLPEFQREYVWNKDQAKQLIVSMYKEYPTGCLLLWKTTEPPEVKNYIVTDNGRLYSLILDGQQRLTTLYMLIKGDIPPYYKEKEIQYDPRDLYINLITEEFKYYQKSAMAHVPEWKPVVDCLKNDDIDPYQIIDEYELIGTAVDDEKTFSRAINNSLKRLRAIRSIDYKELIVPSTASIDEAIDVFDRVNSLGTKLTDAELVLTHITGKWPEARREIKKAIYAYEKHNMYLTLDFMTRCIVIAITKSALLDNIDYDKFTKDDYMQAWAKVKKACDYLLPILRNAVCVHDTNDLSTINLLIPIIAYLIFNNCAFDEQTKNSFLHWMFLAMIWQRYSGQTNQRLDKDVRLCVTEKNPFVDLVNEIVDMRGRTKVEPSDLEGRIAGHPIYKMFYILTKNIKAVDFANGSYIGDTMGDYYSIQSHHIFPRAYLLRNGYKLNNSIHNKQVNEIANRAFITRDTNYELCDEKPSVYIPEVAKKYSSIYKDHYIPNNTEFLRVENYQQFLAERRRLISDGINKFLDCMIKGVISDDAENDTDRISNGEDRYTEFKSSLIYCYKSNKAEKYIEYASAKTICAFLNSDGGKLYIGVSDDGTILGLDNDFELLSKENKKDAFMLRYNQIINKYIGAEFTVFLSGNFISIGDKDLFVVNVSQSNSPCYIKALDGCKEEFYIRQEASSQSLLLSETGEYINNRFNN